MAALACVHMCKAGDGSTYRGGRSVFEAWSTSAAGGEVATFASNCPLSLHAHRQPGGHPALPGCSGAFMAPTRPPTSHLLAHLLLLLLLLLLLFGRSAWAVFVCPQREGKGGDAFV